MGMGIGQRSCTILAWPMGVFGVPGQIPSTRIKKRKKAIRKLTLRAISSNFPNLTKKELC